MIFLLFFNLKFKVTAVNIIYEDCAQPRLLDTSGRDAAVVKLGVVGKFRVCRRVIVVSIVSIVISAANRLIGEVVQSRRRPLLGPSPG